MIRTDGIGCVVVAEGSWGSALHVVRSLGRRGVPVAVGAVGEGREVFAASRFCREARNLRDEDDAIVAALLHWRQGMDSEAPPFLLPTSDRMVGTLHQARDAIGSAYRMAIPAEDEVPSLLDKASVLRAAAVAGLDVPPWEVVSCAGDIERIRGLRLPVIVKPGSWGAAGGASFKFAMYHDHDALAEWLLERVAGGGRLIVQEYVPGPDSSVEGFVFYRSLSSKTVAGSTVRKLRQDAPDGGVMAWGETVPLADLRNASVRLLDELGFVGLGGTEFKRHDGRLWFIELNPRLEAIHFLPMRAGLDLPWIAYADRVLGSTVTPPPADHRVAGWVGAAWIARVRRGGRIGELALDFLRFASYRRKVFAVLSINDPGPWIALNIALARRLFRRRVART